MSDVGYGTDARPVPHDPMSRIDEVNFKSRAHLIILRSGYDLPNGTGVGRNVVYRRAQPVKDVNRDPAKQPDAFLDNFYVGLFTDATNITPDPPDGFNYLDDPYRGEVPERQITALNFPLRTPDATEWGEREDEYQGNHPFLWHCGWAGSDGNSSPVISLLINALKLRRDFKQLGDKRFPPSDDRYRDKEISSMAVEVFYQGTHPASSGVLMCEFAAYKYTDQETSGDFFTVDQGSVYANSVRLLKRAVVKVDTSVLLPTLRWTYNLQKEISCDGGILMTEAELLAFTNQPGG